MIGVAINAAGILLGGIFGLTRKKPLAPAHEQNLKLAIALGTICFGLQLVWKNVDGSFSQVLKQLFIVLISMSLGKLLGKLLYLQKFSNSLGRYATERLSNASSKNEFNDGFIVTALLACANPLAIFAAVDEGLSGFSLAFVVKALMDGLAAMSFISIFGWGVLISFLPVVAFQGTIVLLVRASEPFLKNHGLLESVCATNGLLIFSASLIILNLKKVELTDYLPSLAVAPALTWILR